MDDSPDPTTPEGTDPELDGSFRDRGLELVKANWVRIAGAAAVLSGILLFGVSVWLGMLGVASGVATLAVTGFGQEWERLSAPQKVFVAGPGIALGLAGAAVLLAAAALAVGAFHVLRTAGPVFLRGIFTNDYYRR